MIEDNKEFDAKQLQKLLDAIADESITESQEAELQELLKGNKAARRTYLEFTHMLDSLHWSAAESMVDLPEVPLPHREPAKDSLRFPFWVLSVAALIIISFIISYNSSLLDDSIGDLQASSDAVWQGNTQNGRIDSGLLSLKSGKAKIILDSGAELNLTAPATVDLVSSLRVRMERGTIRVKAPDSAMGFRLETIASDFVDIGTEFEVTVGYNNSSEVHVIDGLVIARPNHGEMIVPFAKNESARIDPVFGDVVSIESKRVHKDILLPNEANNYTALPDGARVIFMGDRATDFETYLHMINQAIHDFDSKKAPVLLNAGMTCRLFFEEDEIQDLVFDLNPTHAVLAFGSEIAAHFGSRKIYRIPPNDFKAAIVKVCDRLEKSGVQPILMTGYPFVLDDAECVSLLNSYNLILRQIAKNRNYRVAEVDREYEMYELKSRHAKLVMPKGLYPTFEGHRLIARSILDSFGYSHLEVPKTLRFQEAEGLIKDWWVSPDLDRKKDFLTEEMVKNVDYSSWTKLSLPMAAYDDLAKKMLVPHMTYPVQARSLGVAMPLTERYWNKARAYTEYLSDEAKDVYLNIGGDVKEIWLNEEEVRKDLPGIYSVGRHIGFYRIPIKLKKGVNKILLEAQNSSFISITENKDWGLQPPAAK